MTLRTASLFIALLAALTQSAVVYQKTGVVGVDKPFNDTILPAAGLNFQAPPTFKVTGNTNDKPVAICLVLKEFGLPHWTQYNEDNCVFFLNVTVKPPVQMAFPLLDATDIGGYELGIYFSTPQEGEINTTVAVELDGDTCVKDSYWDDQTKGCIAAIKITSINETLRESFGPASTKIFTFDAGNLLSHFMLSFPETENANVMIRARFMGAPLKDVHDYTDKNGELMAVAPLPGRWVFNVHAQLAVDELELNMEGRTCPMDKVGENCTTVVPKAFNNASFTIGPQQWMYLRFDATDKQGLLFSATTANNSDIPRIFASRGQIPTFIETNTFLRAATEKVSANIINCNREFCDVVRSIAYNVTEPEEWYIGIYSDANLPIVFAFWFNTTCIPNCELDNHGQCDPAGSGRCICEIDYEGIDCGISKGLGPQYIVLIIIASLVVASAIIGFVAWAYMRRKRADYEIVS